MPTWITRRPPAAQNVATTTDLLTPPSLLEALGALRTNRDGDYILGPDPFDVDPCASSRQPWPTARTMFTTYEDGWRDWSGLGEAWVNPPYGKDLYAWLSRLAEHGNGMALLYARTDTTGFRDWVWKYATAAYFFTGRLWFHQPITGEQCPANCGGPMLLAAYGAKSAERLKRLSGSDYAGHAVQISNPKRKKR